MGRHEFYNDSVFDGGDAGADERDDAAVAPDKAALVGDGAPTFANVTGYTRGINGVMVDVSRLPASAPAIGASSFLIETAPAGDVVGWGPGPAPASVTVRRGAGDGGSDRVTLTWADGAAL